MAAQRSAGSDERKAVPGRAVALDAILAVLGRALDVDRAALVLEDAPGGVFGLDPTLGPEAIDQASWTLRLPLRSGAQEIGVLLLHTRGDRPLPAAEHALVEQVAAGLVQIAESQRLAEDVTRTRDLLARADRLSALGMLAAGVAHDIRNPLVSVRTFIQLLPERLADEEFRTDFRDLALGEIERICDLINDLLAFSRPAPIEREPTDLNELVAQITRLLDAEARRRDVSVVWHADPALPLVVVGDAQVKQVLMNLILNAIQACGAHGSVEITTRIEEGRGQRWATVVIADSGTGIAPEHMEQIFDPFFTTKDAGSGLGLFIARQIVAAHGGEISVVPRPEGGTAFSIHFPVQGRVADAR